MPRLCKVQVDIYEAATDYKYPVVSHTFLGRTKKEAWGYHESHRRTDDFLRSCEDKGKFGDVVCDKIRVYEGWIKR